MEMNGHRYDNATSQAGGVSSLPIGVTWEGVQGGQIPHQCHEAFYSVHFRISIISLIFQPNAHVQFNIVHCLLQGVLISP